MTRFEQTKHLIAEVFAHQVVAEVPVSSPQTVELLAQTLCEWWSTIRTSQFCPTCDRDLDFGAMTDD